MQMRTIKTSISIPEVLVLAMDAERGDISRSAFVSGILAEYFGLFEEKEVKVEYRA
jgi:metal-responsive CopG/Arc/MetJ family transcriptional regulator